MRIAVFGASGPTGQLLVQQALGAGHHVTAATRRPEAFALRAPQLCVVGADVTDDESVDRVVAGSEAVISTVGVPYTPRDVRVYSEGATSVIRAMRRYDVRRLVCVTSTTVAHGDAPDESML